MYLTHPRRHAQVFGPKSGVGLWLFVVFFLFAGSLGAQTRERVLINSGWKFYRYDPSGKADALIYDVRPQNVGNNDGRAADARPEDAVKMTSGQEVLKYWVLPTGNAFFKDPARRYTRPPGNPGMDFPFVQAAFDDSGWKSVDLPHDWAISGPFYKEGNAIIGGGMGRLPVHGVAWYRRKLTIPKSDAGRSVFLDVDGAMSYAMVWINGKLAGGWPYGYNSWRVDLTPYLAPGGINQLAIRLDNPVNSARWYPGAGIYRDVWLTKTQPVHVAQWGTTVTTTDVSRSSARIGIDATIDNDSDLPKEVTVSTAVYRADEIGRRTGKPVLAFRSARATINSRSSTCIRRSAILTRPKLWGPPPTQHPTRYVAVTTVSYRGKTTDSYETLFGIRELRFDAEKGIFVNGEKIVIKGVDQHHDLGSLGAAFNLTAAERQLRMLADMGCNAIRMSHNPPDPKLLDLTDRMGFLVMDEVFDTWEQRKTPLDFHLVFPDWYEQDLRAMIRRDRNHPSVILWSFGNEVGEQYTDEKGADVARKLYAIAKDEDPTRPTTTAMNYAKPDMPLPSVPDVISLNYQGEGIRYDGAYESLRGRGISTPPMFPAFHQKYPGKVILSSENASAFSSRGEYMFPVFPGNSAPVRDGQGGDSRTHHVSAYELHSVDFGASADKVFASLDQHPYVAGGFVWTGWDHLGEPTPYYSSRSSYCGIIDMAGFKKDRFYLYQSYWRPELPMAHLLPHWNWPGRAGLVTPVHLFTSGDEAELFLNGKSQGRKKKGKYDYRLRWDDVIYAPGELHAVVYKDGKKWTEDVVKTTGPAERLVLKPDRASIRTRRDELSFVTVSVADKNGLAVPTSKERFRVSIEGPGELVAIDNGDPTNLETFSSPTRELFNGYALVIVRGTGKPGSIIVKAESGSMAPSTAVIQVKN